MRQLSRRKLELQLLAENLKRPVQEAAAAKQRSDAIDAVDSVLSKLNPTRQIG
jgi:hypothetical protein